MERNGITYVWLVEFSDGHKEIATEAIAARELVVDYVNEAYASSSDPAEVKEVLSEIRSKYMNRKYTVEPFARVEMKRVVDGR